MDFVAKNYDLTDNSNCLLIGEIGVNHNRDKAMLFKLIDAGIEAGVDIIKLQRFNSALEISQHAALADYQCKTNASSQLAMAKQLELPDEWLVEAYHYCKQQQVGFLCAAFDRESVDFIADHLGCRSLKVPSPELSNKPLLQQMAKRFSALIVSTGASTLDECQTAVHWLHDAKDQLELAMMHCTSQYPAAIEQANLRAINTLEKSFQVPVGYSDHTPGIIAPVVAATLGATFIEKHYTLDKSLPGPDHQASVDIPELTELARAIKLAKHSLGNGVKQPAAEESETRPKIRKSAVCGRERLQAGAILSPTDIEVKRPWVAEAIQACDIEQFIGRKLRKDKCFDEPLLATDFE